VGHSKGNPKRKVYSHVCIYYKHRSQVNNNVISQTPRKTSTSRTQTRREIIKIRAKINELETTKPYKESMKQKTGT
jgi:hypothetical protein